MGVCVGGGGAGGEGARTSAATNWHCDRSCMKCMGKEMHEKVCVCVFGGCAGREGGMSGAA